MSSVASNWKGKMYLQSKWLRAIYKDILKLKTSHFVLQDHQENKVAASCFPTFEASTQSKDKHKTQPAMSSRICSISFNMRAFSASNLEISWNFSFSWLSVVLSAIHFGFVEVIFELQSLWSPFCGGLGRSFWKLNPMNPNRPRPLLWCSGILVLCCCRKNLLVHNSIIASSWVRESSVGASGILSTGIWS